VIDRPHLAPIRTRLDPDSVEVWPIAVVLDASPLDASRPVESVRALVELMRHDKAHPGIVALHCAIAGEAVTPGHPAHDASRRRYIDARTRIGAILEACRAAGLHRKGVDPPRAARQARTSL